MVIDSSQGCRGQERFAPGELYALNCTKKDLKLGALNCTKEDLC